MSRIYFDNAATTPLAPEVLEAMMPYMTTHFGNPSSVYSYGRETRMAIEKSRKTVAGLLHVKPAEIFFTSGGTESTNTAINAAVRDLGCTHIITSAIEHHATLHTTEHIERSQSVTRSLVQVLPDGHLNLQHLETLLAEAPGKTLVTLMHANNEIGNLLPVKAVGELCQQYNAYFHCDMVQTIGHYPVDLEKLNIHFANAAAHKFHGPKGVGILFIREGLPIKPFVCGGGQERNMRAGTENVYGIVGFARALELAMENYETDSTYIASLKKYMIDCLKNEIEGVSFNGDATNSSLYTVLNVAFPQTPKSEMLLMNLDINHICASSGSACSSGAEQHSHVISALGNVQQQPIRFSFSKYNTRAEIDTVIAQLKRLFLKETTPGTAQYS
jgi:cysteine desulfurase